MWGGALRAEAAVCGAGRRAQRGPYPPAGNRAAEGVSACFKEEGPRARPRRAAMRHGGPGHPRLPPTSQGPDACGSRCGIRLMTSSELSAKTGAPRPSAREGWLNGHP